MLIESIICFSLEVKDHLGGKGREGDVRAERSVNFVALVDLVCLVCLVSLVYKKH